MWWWRHMVEFPAEWKLVKFLTTKLCTIVWNNSVWKLMSTELLFKNLNNCMWDSVLKFINFNKIWEGINKCDVIIPVYCKQICSNFAPWHVRNFMRLHRLTSIFCLKLCANWASLNYSFDFWIHARPEDDVCSLSQAWSNSLMAGVYSWKYLRPHSFRSYHSLTLKQNSVVERSLFFIIPVIANLYWALLSFLRPSRQPCPFWVTMLTDADIFQNTGLGGQQFLSYSQKRKLWSDTLCCGGTLRSSMMQGELKILQSRLHRQVS